MELSGYHLGPPAWGLPGWTAGAQPDSLGPTSSLRLLTLVLGRAKNPSSAYPKTPVVTLGAESDSYACLGSLRSESRGQAAVP